MKNLEEIKPLWTDKAVKTKYNIRRYNERGLRNYHTFLNGQVHYFPSVTSITKEVMPTNEGLIRWISEHGKAKAEQMAKEAANYGTLMHISMSNFLVRGFFDFDNVDDLIESYIIEERIRHSTYGWAERLKSDMKAFESFVKEHDVKPIAIEIPLMSFRLKVAGTIDLVCEMTVGTSQNGAILKTDRKYDKDGNIIVDKTRRIIVIIDWKSGRNGFYPEHEVQLHLYEMIWSENFPTIKIESVYNWAPKEWESEPGYKLKCQDDSLERLNIPAYLQIFNTYNSAKRNKLHPQITGIAYLDREIEPVTFLTTEEVLMNKFYQESDTNRKWDTSKTYAENVELVINNGAAKEHQFDPKVAEMLRKELLTPDPAAVVDDIQGIFKQMSGEV